MKVTIKGDVYETSADWTFREEREVRRLCGIGRGDVFTLLLEGSSLPVAALAVVGHMRSKPGVPCDFLLDLKPGDEVSLDLGEDPTEAPVKKTKKTSRASS